MILYHGTTEIIKHPDIAFSKNYLDFGRGFYLTTFQKQAEKWALRKSLRKQTKAVVNNFELSEDLSQYRILTFAKENEKWLDFVCACRQGDLVYKEYDIIVGAVANDDVFKTVDMYFRGLWDKEKALNELRYYKMSNQICIVNQDVIEKELKYLGSYEVNQNGR